MTSRTVFVAEISCVRSYREIYVGVPYEKNNILQGIRANKYLLKAWQRSLLPWITNIGRTQRVRWLCIYREIFTRRMQQFFFSTYPNTCTIERVFSTVCARCVQYVGSACRISIYRSAATRRFLFSLACFFPSCPRLFFSIDALLAIRLAFSEYKSDSKKSSVIELSYRPEWVV